MCLPRAQVFFSTMVGRALSIEKELQRLAILRDPDAIRSNPFTKKTVANDNLATFRPTVLFQVYRGPINFSWTRCVIVPPT